MAAPGKGLLGKDGHGRAPHPAAAPCAKCGAGCTCGPSCGCTPGKCECTHAKAAATGSAAVCAKCGADCACGPSCACEPGKCDCKHKAGAACAKCGADCTCGPSCACTPGKCECKPHSHGHGSCPGCSSEAPSAHATHGDPLLPKDLGAGTCTRKGERDRSASPSRDAHHGDKFKS